MMEKDETEGRQKLTDDIDNDHTQHSKLKSPASAEFDSRIVELVRFLARSAAEKDYAELLDKTRREMQSGNQKENLQ
ncbi:hypothetical protein LRS73_27770 [Methylobacterium currus]|uniref:hypothetical protein n=1 Tax=Methylobacterium currus TaxID=2051553 RepID=UPI001E40CDBB|nr:hypothetical protein [Methylobacterium currus]UHC16220.1 hypothetical protein LRS73_27770 [Methylobacterium currus]